MSTALVMVGLCLSFWRGREGIVLEERERVAYRQHARRNDKPGFAGGRKAPTFHPMDHFWAPEKRFSVTVDKPQVLGKAAKGVRAVWNPREGSRLLFFGREPSLRLTKGRKV